MPTSHWILDCPMKIDRIYLSVLKMTIMERIQDSLMWTRIFMMLQGLWYIRLAIYLQPSIAE